MSKPTIDTMPKFINRCLDCGHVQDSGPCEVCPHIPGFGGPNDHFERRPCKSCGSANLTSELTTHAGNLNPVK